MTPTVSSNDHDKLWLKPLPSSVEAKIEFLVDETARNSGVFPTADEVSRMHWALHDAFLDTDEPTHRIKHWSEVRTQTDSQIDDAFKKVRNQIAAKAKELFRPGSPNRFLSLWGKNNWTVDEAATIACGWQPHTELRGWCEKYSDEIVPARIFQLYRQVIETAMHTGALGSPIEPAEFQKWWVAWLEKRPEFLQSNIRPTSVDKMLPLLWVLAQRAAGGDPFAQDKKKRLKQILDGEDASVDAKTLDTWLRRGKALQEARANAPEIGADDDD